MTYIVRTVLGLGVVLSALACNSAAATPAPSTAPTSSSTPAPVLSAVPATPTPSAKPAATAAATQTATVLLPPPIPTTSASPNQTASASGVTGTWTGSWTNSPDFGTPPATGSLTVTMQQSGTSFTGNTVITGPTCDSGGASSGTVVGNVITFGWQSDPQRPVQFEGTIVGDTMSGTWNAIACPPVSVPIYGTWQLSRSAGASTKP